jgi:hypothetical protein
MLEVLLMVLDGARDSLATALSSHAADGSSSASPA